MIHPTTPRVIFVKNAYCPALKPIVPVFPRRGVIRGSHGYFIDILLIFLRDKILIKY
jgi:hypothetical protein